MKINRESYHFFMAYLGSIILATALTLELFHGINIYNYLFLGCGVLAFLIYAVKWVLSSLKNEHNFTEVKF